MVSESNIREESIAEPAIAGWDSFLVEMKQGIQDAFDFQSPYLIHAPSTTGTGGSRILRHIYQEFAAVDSWPPLNRTFKRRDDLESERRKIRPARQGGPSDSETVWFPLVTSPTQNTTSVLLESLEWLRDVYEIKDVDDTVIAAVSEAAKKLASQALPSSMQKLRTILQTSFHIGRIVADRRVVGGDLLRQAESLAVDVADALREVSESSRVLVAVDGPTVDATIATFLRCLMMRGAVDRKRRLAVVVTLPDPLGLLNEIPRRIEMSIPRLDRPAAEQLARSLNSNLPVGEPITEKDQLSPLEVVHAVLFPERNPTEVYFDALRELHSEYPAYARRVAEVLGQKGDSRRLIPTVWTVEQEGEFSEGIRRLGWILDRDAEGKWDLSTSNEIHEACAEACDEFSISTHFVPIDVDRILSVSLSSVTEIGPLLGAVLESHSPSRYTALVNVLDSLASVNDPALCQELATFQKRSPWHEFVYSLLLATGSEARGDLTNAMRLRKGSLQFLPAIPKDVRGFELVMYLSRSFVSHMAFNEAMSVALLELWAGRQEFSDDQRAVLRRKLRFSLMVGTSAQSPMIAPEEATRIIEEIERERLEFQSEVAEAEMGIEAKIELALGDDLDEDRVRDLARELVASRGSVEAPRSSVRREYDQDLDRCLQSDSGWAEVFDRWKDRITSEKEAGNLSEVEEVSRAGLLLLAGSVRIRSVTTTEAAVADWRRVPTEARYAAGHLLALVDDASTGFESLGDLPQDLLLVLPACRAAIDGDSYSFKRLGNAIKNYVQFDDRDVSGLAVSGIRYIACTGNDERVARSVIVEWFRTIERNLDTFGQVSNSNHLMGVLKRLALPHLHPSRLLTSQSLAPMALRHCRQSMKTIVSRG